MKLPYLSTYVKGDFFADISAVSKKRPKKTNKYFHETFQSFLRISVQLCNEAFL